MNECDLVCEKEILAFGRDDFLLLVLSLNNNKQGVLRQSMRQYISQGGLRGTAGRGV